MLMSNEIKTIPSYEVAEMMNKPHWEVLRMLEGYEPPKGSKSRKVVGIIPTLNDNNVVVVDYFIESTYVDKKGEARKCYECSKMGCELLANKMTGEKGILFTAKYVKKFNEMEQLIALANAKAMALLRAVESTGEESAIAIKQYTELRVQEETQPLMLIIDNVIRDDDLYDIGIVGKILKPYNKNFGSKKIFKYLRDEKILINKPGHQNHNVPYDKYSNYFIVKTVPVDNGEFHMNTSKTYFNGKGVKWLLNRLARNGMIQPREKEDILKEIAQ